MAINVKVGLIGVFDMLKFKKMSAVREKAIQKAPANEIKGEYVINKKAKALHPDFLDLVVDKRVEHSLAGAVTIVFRSKDGNKLPYFRAGQYLSVKMQIGDSFITRPYSISSSPKLTREGKIAITIKHNPNGYAADKFIEELTVGKEVITSAPEGQFYYDEFRDCKHVLALAGGSGITPFLSMAHAIADGIEDFDLTILFGSRNEESILFKDELDEICKATNRVKVVHVLSDEKKDGYENGFISEEIIRKYLPENSSIFICGPEAMYRFLEKETAKLNLPSRLIRSEMMGITTKVWEEPGYPEGIKDKVFKITVRRCGEEQVIDANANETVLVALERAAIKAPSRCRSGECGWCRSKLISGNVFVPERSDGRRFSDKEHNYIHPCASFPVSDLVIDVPGEYY